MKIMVKVAPLPDEALKGKARLRKPGPVREFFTEEPCEAEDCPYVQRHIARGHLLVVEASKPAPKKTKPVKE